MYAQSVTVNLFLSEKKFVRHEIEFVPAKLKVRDIYTTTYECRKCRANGKVLKSPGIPEPVISHSYASAESVAFVMKQKFVNGVPLYRQESEWETNGSGSFKNDNG